MFEQVVLFRSTGYLCYGNPTFKWQRQMVVSNRTLENTKSPFDDLNLNSG